jgi:hypothetical protein
MFHLITMTLHIPLAIIIQNPKIENNMETLKAFFKDLWPEKSVVVFNYFDELQRYDYKKINSNTWSELLFFHCISSDYGTGISAAFKFETVELIHLITKHLLTHRPDGNPQLDIQKLKYVDISLNSISFHFETQTVFAGSSENKEIQKITRIPGDIFRSLYLAQFN